MIPSVITIGKNALAKDKGNFFIQFERELRWLEGGEREETAGGTLFSRLIQRINKSLLEEISLSSYQIIIAWANNQRCLFFPSQSRGIAISAEMDRYILVEGTRKVSSSFFQIITNSFIPLLFAFYDNIMITH